MYLKKGTQAAIQQNLMLYILRKGFNVLMTVPYTSYIADVYNTLENHVIVAFIKYVKFASNNLSYSNLIDYHMRMQLFVSQFISEFWNSELHVSALT